MRYVLLIIFMMSIVCNQLVYAGGLPGNSIFQIETKWTSHSGKKTTLSDFKGQPLILAMVYLSCGFSCPTIITSIQGLETELPPEARKQVRVALVSINPKKDNQEAMKDFIDKRGIDTSRWTILFNSSDGKIRELASALNFKYKAEENGEFTHSFMIVLLDKEGVMRARINSTSENRDSFRKILKSLTSSQ